MKPKRRITYSLSAAVLVLVPTLVVVFFVRCHTVTVSADRQQHSYDTSAYERVLRACVRDGLVDYQRLGASHEPTLDTYLDVIARFGPDTTPVAFPTGEALLAYYLNAYNAIMLKQWLLANADETQPDRTVNRLWFFTTFWRIDGQWMSLDHLEQDIIRRRFNEARIHFALVCGAMGCPPLLEEPFEAESLDEQLNALGRRWLSADDGVRVGEAGRVEISSIFQWYQKDFNTLNGLAGVLDTYMNEDDPRREIAIEAANNGQIEFIPYDWTINDVRNREVVSD